HDRFMIIDDSQVYHIGASLKDLGRKWFAFSRMDFNSTFKLLMKIKKKFFV
ncbi:MAG TPA: DNA-binding protein, partial [bacterium]|nr:DNA-binding protein [bacterium]